jgi:hypothetical protein
VKVYINNPDQIDSQLKMLGDMLKQHGSHLSVVVEAEQAERQRTGTQNGCLHKFCSDLSTALNDAGLDMREVLSKDIFMSWTPEAVKAKLWGAVMKALTGKEKTSQLTTVECGAVYEELNRHIATSQGLSVPWPSQDNQGGRENG